jgi:hypothetical protein
MSFSSKENFYIVSKLTPQQVQAKLDEMVGVHSYQFSGFAADGIFKMQPIANYQKSFGPEIEGIVEAYEDGSRIHVRIQMAKKASTFLQIFIGVMVVGIIAMIVDLFVSKHSNHNFFPWFVIFLVYVPLLSSYQSESKKAKETLLNILEGEERAF